MTATGPRPWPRAPSRLLPWPSAGAARPLPAGSRVRPWALVCLLGWTFLGAAPAASAGIDLRPGEPLRVRKIRPVDCRLVRGFTHSPVDGRVDTRYPTGTVGEWQGLHGTPAVNYRQFNGNDGLHVTLAEAGFDAIQTRGRWRGRVYAGPARTCTRPKAPRCARCGPGRERSTGGSSRGWRPAASPSSRSRGRTGP